MMATRPRGALRRAMALGLGLLSIPLAACGGGGAQREDWPDELKVFVSRKPFEYQGRDAFMRLVDEGGRDVKVSRVVISSPRFDDVIWSGTVTFERTWDLSFELPPGGCGGDVDAVVALTYSIDGGPERISRTSAEDQYDSIKSTLDRNCAESTLREAAEMRLGQPHVTGVGRRSTFVLPLTFTPTGLRDDVTFMGVLRTVLFHEDAAPGGSTPLELVGDPVTVRVRLVPSRCDLHALMEGLRGTFIPAVVKAPDLPPDAYFYLPLTNEDRGALMEFFKSHCGLGA
jgi:hypothetical protein